MFIKRCCNRVVLIGLLAILAAVESLSGQARRDPDWTMNLARAK